MKKLLLFCLLSIAFLRIGIAQDMASDAEPAKIRYRNSVYVELLGNSAVGISGNYERLLTKNPEQKTSIFYRAGVGVFYLPFGLENGISIPMEISLTRTKGFVKPDIGVGITLLNGSSLEQIITPAVTFRLGIKLQKNGSRFLTKIGISPMYIVNGGFLPVPGLALGYSFRKDKK